jgi:glucose/arabinose dehydrogenase
MLTISPRTETPIPSVFAIHNHRSRQHKSLLRLLLECSIPVLIYAQGSDGAETSPRMLDSGLGVRTVVAGLDNPTTMAFLGPDDMLVLEKNTGKVQRVTSGAITGTVLDLPVNFASERGLLGIALHPQFPSNGHVYLYWTESSTAADSGELGQTPLLGNRVDRFVWNGSSLIRDNSIGNVVNGRFFSGNIVRLRALQEEAGQPPAGNHNGGVIAFGPDEKLYVFVGDLGRRGEMQNLPCGPTAACPGSAVPDDQFGGPAPDNAHMSGAILRINDNGTAPTDNPFFVAGAARGGEAGAMLQKVFSYGHRNSFGMAFDPKSGGLWLAEDGDDSFSELNLVRPGMNGGWIQVAGPLKRIAQFKAIETGAAPGACSSQASAGLQQLRWPADNVADKAREAKTRLFNLPGSRYRDPVFSWKYDMAPAAIGFMSSPNLGRRFNGDLFMGAAVPRVRGGYLFRFELTADRQDVAVRGSRLRDHVADNHCKSDLTESRRPLLIGENFGSVTDLRTGPNGNLYAVSLSKGSVYEIFKVRKGKPGG